MVPDDELLRTALRVLTDCTVQRVRPDTEDEAVLRSAGPPECANWPVDELARFFIQHELRRRSKCVECAQYLQAYMDAMNRFTTAARECHAMLPSAGVQDLDEIQVALLAAVGHTRTAGERFQEHNEAHRRRELLRSCNLTQ